MKRADVIAGLSVAGLMLPEAVAYAGIAGLPPQRAILAGIAGCLAYAALGRSRFAIVSPTSSSAAILAATLAAMPEDGAVRTATATLVVAMAGLFFVMAGLARLGGLTGFISRPVLHGFAFGLAITIIVKQLPLLVGAPAQGANIFAFFGAWLMAMPGWSLASAGIGLIALGALLILRRLPALPGAFIVLAGGIALSMLLDLPSYGVTIVGTIDAMPSWPSLPMLSWHDYSIIAQFTAPLVLILFAESWGTIRSLALRHGDAVNANRELGALGVANLASALVQGMPVGAGFSAGSASETAGAATRATGVIAAVGLAVLIAFAAPLVAHLPEPVLAAVVIAALTHALDPAPLVRLWQVNRDQYVGMAAAVGVLVLGVEDGMLAAIALSLAALLRRFAVPKVARLGRLGSSHDYVDLARHSEAIAPPGVSIWRPASPLFFADAERALAQVSQAVLTDRQVRGVVLSLEDSDDIDSTALDALLEFHGMLQKASLPLQLARVHDAVRDLLKTAGAADLAANCSFSVDDAVTALTARLQAIAETP